MSDSDQRKSCRFKVPQARRACELKVEADFLSASLANESKDGFAILIDCADNLKVRKLVELHTLRGCFLVWVVYIRKVARPKDAPPERDSWFKVGLEIKQRLPQRRLHQ